MFNVIIESQRQRTNSFDTPHGFGGIPTARPTAGSGSFDIQDSQYLDMSRRDDQSFDLDFDAGGGGRARGYSIEQVQRPGGRPRGDSFGDRIGLSGALPPAPGPSGAVVFSSHVPDLSGMVGRQGGNNHNHNQHSGAFSNHAGSFDLNDPSMHADHRPRGFSFNPDRLGEPDRDSLYGQPLAGGDGLGLAGGGHGHGHGPYTPMHPSAMHGLGQPLGIHVRGPAGGVGKSSYERRQDLAMLERDGFHQSAAPFAAGEQSWARGPHDLDSRFSFDDPGDGSFAHGSGASRKQIGSYAPEARRAKIAKFLAKRKNRVWRKKIEYDVRKDFANSRVRVKGRFVKKGDEELLRELMGMC
jgi:hypothetical protein